MIFIPQFFLLREFRENCNTQMLGEWEQEELILLAAMVGFATLVVVAFRMSVQSTCEKQGFEKRSKLL